MTKMTALSRITADQNQWLNQHGGPIRKSTFIKEWHDLDNEFWLQVFRDAIHLDETTKYGMPQFLKNNIETCAQHIVDYGRRHPNILNPDPKDTAAMTRQETHISRDTSVKSVFWKTIMQLREYYNRAHNIPIHNQPSDRGAIAEHTPAFEELFEWR